MMKTLETKLRRSSESTEEKKETLCTGGAKKVPSESDINFVFDDFCIIDKV